MSAAFKCRKASAVIWLFLLVRGVVRSGLGAVDGGGPSESIWYTPCEQRLCLRFVCAHDVTLDDRANEAHTIERSHEVPFRLCTVRSTAITQS